MGVRKRRTLWAILGACCVVLLAAVVFLFFGRNDDPEPEQGVIVEPPLWETSWEHYFAVVEIVAATDDVRERAELVWRGVACSVLCANRSAPGDAVIYFPEEWAAERTVGELYLIEYEGGTEKWASVTNRDGIEIAAAPFENGALIFDRAACEAGAFRYFGDLNQLVALVAAAPDAEREEFYDLLPSRPIETGATVEEMAQFFTDLNAFIKAHKAYMLEMGYY